MTLDDLKVVQSIDTELLFHVADICEQHNIDYYLIYGTLIGAVRHGGPIPWDDDVDIAMTRENYIKFFKVAETELDIRNNLKIMGSGSPDYISEIKIGRKGTLYCMPGFENSEIMNQVQLDIFPIDYVKDYSPSVERILGLFRKMMMICKLNWSEKKLLLMSIRKSSHHGKVLMEALLCCSHLLRILFTEKGIEKLLYNIHVDKTKSSGKLGVISGFKLRKWDTEDFETGQKIEYEGRPMSVPFNYSKVLESVYGDYMQLPPENTRYRKHFSEWIFKVSEEYT